jgi:hypothetical protein
MSKTHKVIKKTVRHHLRDLGTKWRLILRWVCGLDFSGSVWISVQSQLSWQKFYDSPHCLSWKIRKHFWAFSKDICSNHYWLTIPTSNDISYDAAPLNNFNIHNQHKWKKSGWQNWWMNNQTFPWLWSYDYLNVLGSLNWLQSVSLIQSV